MWGSMKQLSRAILILGFYNRPENKIAVNRICRIKYLLKTRAVFIIVKSNSKSQADSVTLIFSKVDQLLYTDPPNCFKRQADKGSSIKNDSP